ncbi:MAG: hypothetical protein Q8K66_04170 [Sediminibacterium sp.]|nr:hypothetical protein [Sediminibacterium sp.]MDP3128135.1 hypothetical protein [Sediminibacterium sp.]
METLQILKDKALHAFKNADKNGKQLLADLFDKKVFEIYVFERIQSWNDVYEDHGLNPATALPYPIPSNEAQVWLNTVEKIRLLFESLNEGWKPNYDDANECKYWPAYKKTKGAGFGFSRTITHWAYTITLAGSRLVLKTEALVLHAVKYFDEDLKILYTK